MATIIVHRQRIGFTGRVVPAVILCTCGEQQIELDYQDGLDVFECEKCGRFYNVLGQEVTGPITPFTGENEFGERYYEDY